MVDLTPDSSREYVTRTEAPTDYRTFAARERERADARIQRLAAEFRASLEALPGFVIDTPPLEIPQIDLPPIEVQKIEFPSDERP